MRVVYFDVELIKSEPPAPHDARPKGTHMANTDAIHLLTNEHGMITDALKTIDRDNAEAIIALRKKHQAERRELVNELAALTRALKALNAPLTPNRPTTGKKLSDEHRQKIKDAFAAKKAAATLTLVPALEPAPAASEEQSAAPAGPKLTALESDVLVNGILRNNFQDGADGAGQIWSEQLIANGKTEKVTPKQLPGVVTTLIKKGLVQSDNEAVWLTESGIAVAKAAEAAREVAK